MLIGDIVSTVNRRHTQSLSIGLDSYRQLVAEHCKLKTLDEVNNIFEYLLSKLSTPSTYNLITLAVDSVLNDCFEMVKTQFDYNIVYENDCYTVYKYDNPIGYFYLKLDHINEGTWFDPTDIKNGLRCGTVNMSIQKKTITNNEIVLLWHEIGHAIDHIENDLDTVAHDLWELKAIEFEQRAAELYNIDRSFSIKRDIGIGLIDLNLHTAGYITEEFVIDLVESVQNLLSVNYSMDDFDHIIEGQYAGVYYGYSFARYLFEQGFDYELYKGLA